MVILNEEEWIAFEKQVAEGLKKPVKLRYPDFSRAKEIVFAEDFLSNSKDLEPEYAELLEEHMWDLV